MKTFRVGVTFLITSVMSMAASAGLFGQLEFSHEFTTNVQSPNGLLASMSTTGIVMDESAETVTVLGGGGFLNGNGSVAVKRVFTFDGDFVGESIYPELNRNTFVTFGSAALDRATGDIIAGRLASNTAYTITPADETRLVFLGLSITTDIAAIATHPDTGNIWVATTEGVTQRTEVVYEYTPGFQQLSRIPLPDIGFRFRGLDIDPQTGNFLAGGRDEASQENMLVEFSPDFSTRVSETGFGDFMIGGIKNPQSLAIDAESRQLFVAEGNESRILVFDVVPEPSSAGLLVALSSVLCLRSRRVASRMK